MQWLLHYKTVELSELTLRSLARIFNFAFYFTFEIYDFRVLNKYTSTCNMKNNSMICQNSSLEQGGFFLLKDFYY